MAIKTVPREDISQWQYKLRKKNNKVQMWTELETPRKTGLIDVFGDEVYQFTEELPPIQNDQNTLPMNTLISDNWYAVHPEKILGEPYEVSGRFGKVTKYRGSLDDVNKIFTGINLEEEVRKVEEGLHLESSIPPIQEKAPIESEVIIEEIENEKPIFAQKALSPEDVLATSKALEKEWRDYLSANGPDGHSETLRRRLLDFNKKNFEIVVSLERGTDYLSKTDYEYGSIDFSKISGWIDATPFYNVENGRFVANELGKILGIINSPGSGSAFRAFKPSLQNALKIKEAYEELGYKVKVSEDFSSHVPLVPKVVPDLEATLATINPAPEAAILETDQKPLPIQAPSLESIMQVSREEITKKTVQKAKKKREIEEFRMPEVDMQSFEEIYRLYNPEISHEELRVYVWYKYITGNDLSQKWHDLASQDGSYPSVRELHALSSQVIQWVKDGLIYYHKGQLLPSFLYLAENIWERVIDLESDRAHIVDSFGQDIFDRQHASLTKLFHDTVYKNRLILEDVGESNSLKITPISEFAKKFKIRHLGDEQPFQLRTSDGVPDLLFPTDNLNYRQKQMLSVVSELSLTEAFVVWMVQNRNKLEYKRQVSYIDIYKAYIKQSPRPRNPTTGSDEDWKAQWERIKENAQTEGDRLFAHFLSNEITLNDKVRIETEWNTKFNGYLPIDYNKVPVAFPLARNYRGEFVDVRPEKREAVAFLFNDGSGLLGYDVGFGKTPSFIFAARQAMEAGYAKRPLVAVPNQVYRQFMAEFRGFMPDVPLVDLYNLSNDYLQELKGKDGKIMPIPEGSVAFVTYEGLEKIGFSEETRLYLLESLYEILENVKVDKKFSQRQKEQFTQKLETSLGIGLRGTVVTIEELGIDLLGLDEAHNQKKVFTRVAGEGQLSENAKGDLKVNREKTPYKIESGQPSARGLKAFMLAQYIQHHNKGRNVYLLTATPFTNSPLEVYSMLALTAYSQLQKSFIQNISVFFDQFIDMEYQLVIDAHLNPVRKQVVTGFRNLPALQQLIFRFINFKNGETKDKNGNPAVKITRPNKWTLPLRYKIVDGKMEVLQDEEKISTVLPMTPAQESIMSDIRMYVEGKISYDDLCNVTSNGKVYNEDADTEDETIDTEAEVLTESSLSDEEKRSVRMLRGISMARNLAISPYMFECHSLGAKPTSKQFVEESPKMHYIMLCIADIKKFAESHGVIVPGQIIYMDRGKEFMPLLKEYLIEVVGYKPHEVRIVTSGMPKVGPNSKESIKNLFNGQQYNEATRSFEEVDDDQRVKIVIGTSTIKEGMNLQKYCIAIYNATVDWNPTDYQQLEGRGWRQGNTYLNIVINTPLMENSMDIFIFQKLEEKSRRINQIWSHDRQGSVFKFEEFNPEEAKYEMISDPTVLAKLEIEDEEGKYRDNMAMLESETRRIVQILQDKKLLEGYRAELIKEASKFRTLIGTESVEALVKKIQDVFKTQLDEQELAKPQEEQLTIRQKYPNDWYLKYYGYRIPEWLGNVIVANRRLKKEEANYLGPRNLTLDQLESYSQQLQAKLEVISSELKELHSEESVRARTQMVIERREAMNHQTKSVQERAKEAAKLNWIVLERVISQAPSPVAEKKLINECPPLDKEGKRRIDPEAIAIMNYCIENLPQTKNLHLLADTEDYTPARVKLHEKLIADLMKSAKCITHDQPIAILTGGLPGAGKSTYLKKHATWLNSETIFHIDADEIRSKLPEYKGWNANATYLETKDIVSQLLENIGHPCNYDIVYDGTMNKAKNYIPLIEKLKQLGYRVFVLYFKVPYEISVQRVLERYQKTGRYVPLTVIQEAFEAGTSGFELIKSMVDGYRLIDGVTGATLETGGMQLPDDRQYTLPDNANQPTAEQKKARLKLRLELLREMHKEDKKNDTLKHRINLVKEMLEEM